MENYGRRLVIDRPFHTTLAALTEALGGEDLDVIGRVDVREVMKRSLHRDVRQYEVLQVAAPQLLLEVLREDLGAATVLPAAVAVFELADGEPAVIVSEPFAGLVNDEAWRAGAPHLAAIADRECERLARALDRLQRGLTASGARMNAATCRWATPTLLLDSPLWIDAERSPWTCVREGKPRVLESTEPCEHCASWEPRTT